MEAEQEYYRTLIERLRRMSDEIEWLEYKMNNEEPQMIGEYISALSNSATIWNREKSYIIWGIDDISREIEGTKFSPKHAKVGNQELENWLITQLSPRVDFKYFEIEGLCCILYVDETASSERQGRHYP